MMGVKNPYNVLVFFFTLAALLVCKVQADYDPGTLSACEQELIARQIFYPKSGFEMHANALRNQLKRIVENYLIANDGIQYADEDNQPNYDSVDLDALEKHTAAVLNGKRNGFPAMARMGQMRVSEAEKRSLATLAKNGQLPSRESSDEDGDPWSKRNIGSIARGGSLTGKRNIGALARDYVLPKRNLPSILRSGGGGSTSSTHGPQNQPKRNIAALARDEMLPSYHSRNEKRDVSAAINKHAASAKRNIGAAKNSQAKVKRDATYDDFPDQSEIEAYQNGPFNYNDWSELYAFYGMPEISNEKRFLGRILPPTRATSATNRRRL